MNLGDEADHLHTPAEGARSTAPPQPNVLAAAALGLGLLSLCTGLLTGIPAIVCGVLSLSRRRSGTGTAITGLVLGSVGTLGSVFILFVTLGAWRKISLAKDGNSLQQVGLAVYWDADAKRRLMAPFARGPDGEPNRGLSWRVQILPYLEEETVYRQFERGQAWDSPANWPASQTVIRQYASTADPPSVQTRFRVFVGPGTLFEDSAEWREDASLARIPDGASQTLMVVESADTVPWASPQELPYQPAAPLPPLGHPNRSTFLVLLADGSVRTLKKSLSPAVLHALITRNVGEALPPNWDQ